MSQMNLKMIRQTSYICPKCNQSFDDKQDCLNHIDGCIVLNYRIIEMHAFIPLCINNSHDLLYSDTGFGSSPKEELSYDNSKFSNPEIVNKLFPNRHPITYYHNESWNNILVIEDLHDDIESWSAIKGTFIGVLPVIMKIRTTGSDKEARTFMVNRLFNYLVNEMMPSLENHKNKLIKLMASSFLN